MIFKIPYYQTFICGHINSKRSDKHVKFIQMQPDYSQVVISNTLDKSAWQLGNIVRTEMEKITRDYSFGKREYPAIKHTCLLIYFTRNFNLYT